MVKLVVTAKVQQSGTKTKKILLFIKLVFTYLTVILLLVVQIMKNNALYLLL